jgi:hypothetical protein
MRAISTVDRKRSAVAGRLGEDATFEDARLISTLCEHKTCRTQKELTFDRRVIVEQNVSAPNVSHD